MTWTTVTVDGETIDTDRDGEVWVHAELDDETRCETCGATIAEYVDGWHGEDDDETLCGEDGRHLPVYGNPVDGASIRVTEEGVQVAVSVADPRGGFQMEVRRLTDGRIILHVPHPDEPMLHAPLTELHPGTFVVGVV